MKKLFNKQKGFTLIELLVVIAILGVIGTVVVLNIGNFIGSGTLEAANVEVHQVQVAITAFITETSYEYSFNATIGPESNYPVNATIREGVHKYMLDPGSLQANYIITEGSISDATPIENSRWGDLWFCSGTWQKDECP